MNNEKVIPKKKEVTRWIIIGFSALMLISEPSKIRKNSNSPKPKPTRTDKKMVSDAEINLKREKLFRIDQIERNFEDSSIKTKIKIANSVVCK